MNGKKLGIIGGIATVVGIVTTFVSNQVAKLQQEETIRKEVQKALEQQAQKMGS